MDPIKVAQRAGYQFLKAITFLIITLFKVIFSVISNKKRKDEKSGISFKDEKSGISFKDEKSGIIFKDE